MCIKTVIIVAYLYLGRRRQPMRRGRHRPWVLRQRRVLSRRVGPQLQRQVAAVPTELRDARHTRLERRLELVVFALHALHALEQLLVSNGHVEVLQGQLLHALAQPRVLLACMCQAGEGACEGARMDVLVTSVCCQLGAVSLGHLHRRVHLASQARSPLPRRTPLRAVHVVAARP